MLELFIPPTITPENPPLVAQVTTEEEFLPHQLPLPDGDLTIEDLLEPAQPAVIVEYQPILALPGRLNDVPVFNSNSPEIITEEGILLSTFPKSGKANPYAHLETSLDGRFDIFTHHISRPAGAPRTLYQGLLVSNPTGQPKTLKILQGLSYLNSEDAPFRELPPFVEDPDGYVFSGPGSRLAGDLLRGKTQRDFPEEIRIAPYTTQLLFSLPIPASSSRSTYLQLESSGTLYLANLAKYEVEDFVRVEPEVPFDLDLRKEIPDSIEEIFREQEKGAGSEPQFIVRPPVLDEWRSLLTQGRLVGPRDLAPIPTRDGSRIIYGRVAGITLGSQWRSTVGDRRNNSELAIPERGKAVSFPISTTTTGTFNTEQVHSAPMLARYADTALQGHGNYLVHYDLTFPLVNETKKKQRVALTFQTPIKQDQYSDRLTFFDPPPQQVFFRGTVRVRYPDQSGKEVERYVHLVQHRGEKGQPLATFDIPAGDRRTAKVDFFYPPDATPPQVITITTLD
ncbi:MAG: DUF3370 domain-containing protein [Limnothrix sp.]